MAENAAASHVHIPSTSCYHVQPCTCCAVASLTKLVNSNCVPHIAQLESLVKLVHECTVVSTFIYTCIYTYTTVNLAEIEHDVCKVIGYFVEFMNSVPFKISGVPCSSS